jgi:hypothetical protein
MPTSACSREPARAELQESAVAVAVTQEDGRIKVEWLMRCLIA